MLQGPSMAAPHLALLALLATSVPPARPTELCESEMNKVKDQLQVSCVEKGLSGLPAGLPSATGILLLGSNRLGPRLSLAAFQPLGQLSELDLSNNSLSALETGALLPHLQQLTLSHNALESLPDFQGLPSLTHLALGHNALAQLPEGGFHALGGLKDLQLQGNQLQRLPPGAFQGLQDLQDLDLSDNQLEALPRDLLAGLQELAILRLERNRLRTVPDGFFPKDKFFQYIYLAENPWRCDCQLAYLRAWILENDISVYTRVQGAEKEDTENEPESVKCQAPPKEKGRPVMSFQANCRKLGDSDGGQVEGEGEVEGTPKGTPSTPLPSSSAPQLPTMASSTHPATPSTHHSSPATTATPAATAPTTAPLTPTVPRPFPTTASTSSSSSTPAAATTIPTTLAPSTVALTTRVHTAASTTPLAPVSTITQTAPFSQEAATTPSSTFVPPTTAASPPATTPRAATTQNPTAVPGSSTTRGETPSGTSNPASASLPPTLPSPETPATCSCPALPVQSHGATRRRQSPVTWSARLARHCCLLRLVLYLACLVLVVLPTLAGLCCLGWLHLRRCKPASPGAQGLRYRQLRAAGPQGPWVRKPPVYRVCKTFRVAPLRHVSWLLVSLPCPANQEPWTQKEGSLSSYSLDRGRDTLGAVQVRYATSSL